MPTLLVDRLRWELRTAMKTRDTAATTALRTALAAVANAEAVDAAGSTARRGVYSNEVARRHLSDDEAAAIVTGQIQEIEEAAGELDRLGKSDRASSLRAQAAVLEGVLTGQTAPERPSDATP